MPSLHAKAALAFAAATVVVSAAVAAPAAVTPLRLTEQQIERKGSAQLEWRAHAVRVRFDDAGWDSGIRVRPPAGQETWDFSPAKALAVDVENLSRDKQLRLTLHVSSGSREEKNHRNVHSGLALNPGEKRTLQLHLPHPSRYSTPDGVPGLRLVQTDKVTWFELYMQWPFEGKAPNLVDCRISNFRLVGKAEDMVTVVPTDPETFFPFIDVYGQYLHGDWPEKIRSDADLKKAHAAELQELASAKRPADWNEYGGWATGPQLKATGWFRIEKYRGKWYFVDPSGRLFFSHGVDVARAHSDATKSTGHENWFDFKVETADLPFTHWNLQKKYDRADYEDAFYRTLVRRLEHWGFNTIGNWGKQELIALGRMPYVLQLNDHESRLPKIAGSKLKFYDVFDPAYIRTMENLLDTLGRRDPVIAKSVNDPFCIGYFTDNELNYGNRNGQILGDDVLKSPRTQSAKKVFVGDLEKKYTTIEALNTAWKTDYESWDALLESRTVPKTRDYMPDSHVFFRKAVDQYFRLGRDAIKSVAPHRLYLGSRFISTDATRRPLYEASATYCDVLTTNVYANGVHNLRTEDFPDMPVLIGEFHFGVLDRGMFSASLVPIGLTQGERAVAYTRFLQGALANPNIVGTHWFQFRDQPLTGRWDGEGYAIGFVDVADTPYPELTGASREVGHNMYRYRSRGKLINAMR